MYVSLFFAGFTHDLARFEALALSALKPVALELA